MANRLIGVDIAPQALRVAVLEQSRGTFEVIALEQRPYTDAGTVPELLAALIPGGFRLSDRVATALPAGQSYVRTLQFPFRENRKILAAAPFELAAQLPVAVDECQIALLPPQESAGGVQIVAAAVGKTVIDALLAPFEQQQIPLHIVDLMPYALAGGITGTIDTGLLVCLNESEATLSCLAAGRITDYRHFPLNGSTLAEETIRQLLRETVACRHRMKLEQDPVLLAGSLATPQLTGQMREAGLPAELFKMTIGRQPVPPAFIPAVALALRAGKKIDARCFNLRQGAYAYRGEAATLKRMLFAFGGLLGTSLLLFGLATALDYREKNRQADALLQQMTRQYRETFPGSELTVDVPLQMQSKLQELRQRAAALGIDSQPRTLPILKELSVLAARIPYEAEDLTCDESACSLTGSTDSFDAVNRIKEQLGSSTLFARAEVAETRKGIDGSRIEFRLRLPLAASKGEGR